MTRREFVVVKRHMGIAGNPPPPCVGQNCQGNVSSRLDSASGQIVKILVKESVYGIAALEPV